MDSRQQVADWSSSHARARIHNQHPEHRQLTSGLACASLRSQDFKSAATGVTAKAMRAELNKLVQGIDPKERDYKSVSLVYSPSVR